MRIYKKEIPYFNDKIQYFQQLDTALLWGENSIFKIIDNVTTTETEYGGTSPLIYQKTPYVIHQFAKQIGEDRFFSILAEFYRNVNQKQICSFSDFEQTFKHNDVTDRQWNDFMKNL